MPRDRATRRAKTLALVTLPVLLLGGFAAATYTPLFRLRDIRVEGTQSLRPGEVITRAGIGSAPVRRCRCQHSRAWRCGMGSAGSSSASPSRPRSGAP